MSSAPRLVVPICLFLPCLVSVGSFGAAPGLFAEEVFPVGDRPTSIQQADLDKDGRLDLVITTDSFHEVSILFGQADGVFSPRVLLETPDNDLLQSVVADFDDDGRLDLVVGGLTGAWIFMGEDDGAFGDVTPLPVGTFNDGLAVADFDNDGRADLAIAGADGILVFAGNGDGTFADPLMTTGGGFLKSADLNLDGNADLLGRMGVRLGQGNGTFEPLIGVDGGASDGVIDDFNGDGHPDLALLGQSQGSAAVIVYLSSTVQPPFAPPSVYELGGSPNFIQSGDFDGNGRPDLVTSALDRAEVEVLLSNAHGLFGPPTVMPIAFRGGPTVTADYDGDGRIDIAMTSYDSTAKFAASGVAWVLSGRGDGTFVTEGPMSTLVGRWPVSTVVADFNGDGDTDVATANRSSEDVSILLGDGAGHFEARPALPLSSGGTSIAAGLIDTDVDPDGTVDLAVAQISSLEVTIFRGAGDGTFAPGLSIPLGREPRSVALGDLNGDGRVDLVTSNRDLDISILLGNGDGSFSFAVPPTVATMGASAGKGLVSIGRLNADEHLDVAVAAGSSVSILHGNGDGTFAEAILIPADANTVGVEDMDLDGRQDLIVVGYGASILLNQGDGAFVESATLSHVDGPLALGDFDGDGLKDIVVGTASYATVALSEGGGLLQVPRNYAASVGTDGGIAVADLNSNGRLDLLSSGGSFPGEVGVYLNRDPTFVRFRTDKATLSWPILLGVASFNLYRGPLGDLIDDDGDGVPDAGYGSCINGADADLTDTIFIDEENPLPGDGFFYLMARVNQNGEETDLGTTSGGLPRTPAVRCPSADRSSSR